ncbi:MAG: hypothetical protein J6K14_10310 [Clostridia bacterium]|nr:hypothetical protein [Clostridia bacterium]
MFQMDEESFAELQKDCCWFTLPIFENLPDIDPNVDVIQDEELWQDDVCVQRHIFAMTFGAFGYSVNLTRARSMALIKLSQIENSEPKDKSLNNQEYIKWLEPFAQYNILLGTVFAYRHEYLLAASLFMNGLKTRAINLFMPYCDFIKYVLSKVAEMPASLAEYDGCGFSVDEPMGSTELNGGTLNTSAAEMIIPALEGDNGEIVLAYHGGQRYGNLRRLGSTNSKNFRNCIDLYEVLIVGKGFNLKKIRFYFNGYFTPQNRYKIRLPKGFHLDPLSKAAQIIQTI